MCVLLVKPTVLLSTWDHSLSKNKPISHPSPRGVSVSNNLLLLHSSPEHPDASAEVGILIFTDLSRLKTRPDDRDYCAADYSPDRIVFHIKGVEKDVLAVVSSSHILALTSWVLTLTSSSSSSVSVTVEESDSFVLC